MSKTSKRNRPPRRWFILVGIVIAVCLLFLVVYNLVTYDAPTGGSEVTETPDNDSSTPHGNPNEHYGELVRQQNEQSYDSANDSGDSFVPTVGAYPNEGLGLEIPEPEPKAEPDSEPVADIPQPDLDEKPAPETDPAPADDQPRRNEQIGIQRRRSADTRNTTAIQKELRQIMKQQNLPEQQVAVYWKKEEGDAERSGRQNSRDRDLSDRKRITSTGQSTAGAQATPTLPPSNLRAGDIFYASTNTALDSDQPGPAMATIVAGEHKGDKFLGSFERREDRLVVEFDRFVPSGGEPRSITAFAVDTDTSKASVATAVDHHYLSRWGGLLAASFAEGFGRAVQRSGSTVTTSVGTGGSNSIIVNPERSAGKEAIEALGEVGETAGRVMERNFDRPPTVEIAVNTPIGILVTKGGQ